MAQERTVSLQGGMFETHLLEEGEGPPLVFLHDIYGLGGWPSWLSSLAAGRRAIAPEHPGFGQSTGLQHLDNFIDLALYYLDLMDALGLTTPDILGHSFGGNIAAEMAAISPERVGKLVLIAPTGFWNDATPGVDSFTLNAQDTLRHVWHDPEWAKANGFAPQLEGEDARREMLERNKNLAAAGKFLWPIPDKGLKKRIHRIKAPTLLIWGVSDGLVPPEYGDLFSKSIAGSRLVVLDRSGHIAHGGAARGV